MFCGGSLGQSTKLGIVVGRLRTHEDKNVADLAKDTVRKWKNDVGGSKKPDGAAPSTSSSATTTAATVGKAGSAPPAKLNAPVSNGAGKAEGTAGPLNGPSPAKAKAPRTSISDNIAKDHTKNKVRDGSILLLYNSIALDRDERSLPPRFPLAVGTGV